MSHDQDSVAAVYVLRRDGAALLQLRDDNPAIPHPGKWVPPGGHCEPGEDVFECARRELEEETTVAAVRLFHLARFVDDHAAGFPPLDLSVFWAAYDGIQEPVCREGQRVAFIIRADAERIGVPGYLIELWDEALASARYSGAIPSIV